MLKKTIFLVFLALLVLQLSAWKLEHGFEEEVPAAGWAVYYATQPASSDDEVQQVSENSYNGEYSARMSSFDTDNADSWLFTPAVTIATGDILSYWIDSYNQDYVMEQYEIWVCSSQNPDSTLEQILDAWAPLGWTNLTNDLSSYAGQEIYIGFRYNNDNRYGIYLDDVKIGQDTSLLCESFEAIWNSSPPYGPAGWSESNTADGSVIADSDWDRDDNSHATDGNYVAYMYQSDSDTDDWLISPSIDLTSNDRTDYLAYYIRLRYLGEGDYLYVKISTDGGSSWEVLKTYTNNEGVSDYPLTRQEIDLSDYNQENDVKIAFHGDYNNGYRLRVYLDYVVVDQHGEPGICSIDNPADEDTNVDVFTALSWHQAQFATSYDVYLGTEEAAVLIADNTSPTFQGNTTATSYSPANYLKGNTTYFWRIDALNQYGSSQSSVWSFTTGIDPNSGGGNAENGGYYYSNNLAQYAQSAPTYEWIDITDGNEVYAELSSGDGFAGGAAGYSIGFDFPFFGQTYDKFWIAADGFITFGSGAGSPSNQNIPEVTGPNNLIALFWTDLYPASALAGDALYYKNFSDKLVVTFQHYHVYMTLDDTRWFTGQIILYHDGRIKLQYKERDADLYVVFDELTVGIENADGTKGVNYYYNEIGGPLFQDAKNNIAIMFGTDPASLPVELSAFSATFAGNRPNIAWTTQSENNNSGWNLYRGNNETDFDQNVTLKINNELIEGAGTTSEPSNYNYTDIYEVEPGNTYWYWLESVANNGETETYGPITLNIPEEQETPELPQLTKLIGNYPNPFNPQTTIEFQIKAGDTGKLTIYNSKGQVLETKKITPEQKQFTWEASRYGSGIYFYKLETENYSDIKKMILLK
ncbi:MAG: hypothetical protein PWQ09_1679 [Candidatus Cloacimonadota bacterium]|nr:hypothetical protein [Candidatus Cloacimonadota bacterium]